MGAEIIQQYFHAQYSIVQVVVKFFIIDQCPQGSILILQPGYKISELADGAFKLINGGLDIKGR